MTPAAVPRPALPAAPESQRFGATLVLSVLVHVLVIAGIGFAATEPAPLVPTLDVIFSEASTELTPAQADFLAAARNAGGGQEERAHRPRETRAGWLPRLEAGSALLPQEASATPPPPPAGTRVVSSRQGTPMAVPARPVRPPVPAPEDLPLSEEARRRAEMARLAAEVHQRAERYARRPNRKFVSASTREYAYAGYLRAWVDRAERVGNLNYPDAARQRRLGGQVVITVGVRRDGSVESARVLRSSGIPLLDAAALRIVDLAAPFPPLPETGDGVDVLQVTRTWSFLPDGDLQDVGG